MREKISLLFFVALATVTGHLISELLYPPRPDPFTGQEGRELEAKLMARDAQLEARLNQQRIEINELRSRQETYWGKADGNTR